MAPRTSIAPGYMTQLAQIRAQQKMQEEQIESQEKIAREKMWMDMGRTVVGGAFGLAEVSLRQGDRLSASKAGTISNAETFGLIEGQAQRVASADIEHGLAQEERLPEGERPFKWKDKEAERARRLSVFNEKYKSDPFGTAVLLAGKLSGGSRDLSRGVGRIMFKPKSEGHLRLYKRSLLAIKKLVGPERRAEQTQERNLQEQANKMAKAAKDERWDWDPDNVTGQHVTKRGAVQNVVKASIREWVKESLGVLTPENVKEQIALVEQKHREALTPLQRVYWALGGDINFTRDMNAAELARRDKSWRKHIESRRAGRTIFKDETGKVQPEIVLAQYRLRGRTVRLTPTAFAPLFPESGSVRGKKSLESFGAALSRAGVSDASKATLLEYFSSYADGRGSDAEMATLFGLKQNKRGKSIADKQGQTELLKALLKDELADLDRAGRAKLLATTPKALTTAIKALSLQKPDVALEPKTFKSHLAFYRKSKLAKDFARLGKKESMATAIATLMSEAMDDDTYIKLSNTTISLRSRGKKLTDKELTSRAKRYVGTKDIVSWYWFSLESNFVGPMANLIQVLSSSEYRAKKEDIKKILERAGILKHEGLKRAFENAWNQLHEEGTTGMVIDPQHDRNLRTKAKQIQEVLSSGLNPFQQRRIIGRLYNELQGA